MPKKTLSTPHTLPSEHPKPSQWKVKQDSEFIESEPTCCLLLPTQNDLPCCDDVPLESERHRKQMDLLISSLEPWLGERGYVGGNMFMHFSLKQEKNQDVRGPDVFVSLGVSNEERKSWVVWEEHKTPDVVIELLSKTTAFEDKHRKDLPKPTDTGSTTSFLILRI